LKRVKRELENVRIQLQNEVSQLANVTSKEEKEHQDFMEELKEHASNKKENPKKDTPS